MVEFFFIEVRTGFEPVVNSSDSLLLAFLAYWQPFRHLTMLLSFQAVNQFAYIERLLDFVVRTGLEPVLVVHLSKSISSNYVWTLLYH